MKQEEVSHQKAAILGLQHLLAVSWLRKLSKVVAAGLKNTAIV